MRTTVVAVLLALASVAAYAADDSLDKSAKKTGDNFGNLLKGMGQEVKKTGVGGDAKKSDKKAAKADPKAKEDKK
jgi:hypothetical protein